MSKIERVNYFYVGKDGGCQIVWGIESQGSEIKAYIRKGDWETSESFSTSRDNFYRRIREFKPRWLQIDEELKSIIESYDIPVYKESGQFVIRPIYYQSDRSLITSPTVKPFWIDGDLFFHLHLPTRGDWYLTPQRLQRHCIMNVELTEMTQQEVDQWLEELIGKKRNEKN